MGSLPCVVEEPNVSEMHSGPPSWPENTIGFANALCVGSAAISGKDMPQPVLQPGVPSNVPTRARPAAPECPCKGAQQVAAPAQLEAARIKRIATSISASISGGDGKADGTADGSAGDGTADGSGAPPAPGFG